MYTRASIIKEVALFFIALCFGIFFLVKHMNKQHIIILKLVPLYLCNMRINQFPRTALINKGYADIVNRLSFTEVKCSIQT